MFKRCYAKQQLSVLLKFYFSFALQLTRAGEAIDLKMFNPYCHRRNHFFVSCKLTPPLTLLVQAAPPARMPKINHLKPV